MKNKDVQFTVRGLPAPQGSKKAVGQRKSKRTGRMVTVMAESSKAVKPWRAAVEAVAAALVPRYGTFDGPLWVHMTFTLPRPARVPKLNAGRPITRPDLSKLVRSTEDALTDSGLIADDGRITDMHVRKRYVGGAEPDLLTEPGVVIVVRELEPRE